MKKVIDIEERIPSMRERRRRRTNRKFIFILTVFVLLLLTVLYFQSSLSKIAKISIDGTNLHEAEVYLDASGIAPGKSLWGFSKNDVVEKLLQVEGVQEATVTREWFRDIAIHVKEWKPVAYIEANGDYSLLLENGNIFNDSFRGIEEDAPILNGFTEVEQQKKIAQQLLAMENNVYQLISEIVYTGSIEDPDYITVFMDDGYEVRALMPTLAEKLMYYSEIVAQLTGDEKGVIDMEVGTFFTPYSQYYGLDTFDEEEKIDE